MTIQPALVQMFVICALSAAVEVIAGEDAFGIRVVCGLSVMLSVMRLAMGILG